MQTLTHQKVFGRVQQTLPKCIKKNDIQALAEIFDTKIR